MTRFLPAFKNRRAFAALLVAGFVGLAACDTDTTEPTDGPGAAPPLPAASSMDVDFDLFGSGGGAEATMAAYNDLVELGDLASGTQLHFGAAALSVLVAKAVTVIHLAVPVAVFGAAANNTPSFEEDNRWHWRYTASHLGELWTAHLSGVVAGTAVDWEMRITAPQSDPPLTDFLWYGGISQTDGLSGTWRFYDPLLPSGQNETVRVDWSHESSDVHGVTITVTGGDNAGDMLIADHDGSTRFVTWTDASSNETVEIFWDIATGEGYITAPNFNGGIRSCWDASQNDVACS